MERFIYLRNLNMSEIPPKNFTKHIPLEMLVLLKNSRFTHGLARRKKKDRIQLNSSHSDHELIYNFWAEQACLTVTYSIFSLTFGTVWNKMVWKNHITCWRCCAQNVGWKLRLKTALTELASLSGLNFYVNQFLFFCNKLSSYLSRLMSYTLSKIITNDVSHFVQKL